MSLNNVCVDFPVYGSQRSLRKALFQRATGGLISHEGRRHDRIVINALHGITLQLNDGDRLGLIGHNGAGKSTLLRTMAGVYTPTQGTIATNGRVTPMLNTMPGLDGEDTGYENILTCGLLHGMSPAEIERKIPEIEEFSELGEYLALPVRTYSAGMVARLSVSIATAIDPEILLIDEGIGAGDARFAEQAALRLKEFIGRSRILVLASHSEAFIHSFCDKAALLQSGHLLAFGAIDDVLKEYRILAQDAAAQPLSA
jgi:ABC-type polysaccharide/polyol phosphate transport system ATPase subunit